MSETEYYATQSAITDPGSYAAIWDEIDPELETMKAAIHPLVFHYSGQDEFQTHGIDPERIEEVNLRTAERILGRLVELGQIVPGEDRPVRMRMVGCCRDWALLLVSLARHHGIPARMRVGAASYFYKDWWVDHTIAEIWDARERRWRFVDAELGEAFDHPVTGNLVDPMDLSPEDFLPGLESWKRMRAGEFDPATYVVNPHLEVPQLRGVPYMWHNTILDLAALNRTEMILWDVWGIDKDEVNDQGAALLDQVAATTTLAEREHIFAHEGLCVPDIVTSYSPYDPSAVTEVVVPRTVHH